MAREQFGSRFAVVAAMAGSAIGLGNIWRFPYVVGENGGAAFVIVYVLATFLVSIPIFLAESVIGRRSGTNSLGATKKLCPDGAWKWLSIFWILTPVLLLSYYSVIGGWSISYLFHALTGDFVRSDPARLSGMFGALVVSPRRQIAAFTLFLALTAGIVAAGVKSGIERFSKVFIPVLFLLILLILVYSVSLPGAKAGVDYLLKPDFSKLTPRALATALGQSFYSLSLGCGIIITYSSYVSREENLVVAGTGTALFDLLFAVMAGFAIMPAVFAVGIAPNSGSGLIFEALPHIFNQMGQDIAWLSSSVAVLFFFCIVIAALTSSVSLLEVAVAYLVEDRKMKRGAAALVSFAVVWVIGMLCALSFGPLSGFRIGGKILFDGMDLLVSNFLMLIGGLLAVLFVGWKMKPADVMDELTNGGKVARRSAPLLLFMIRYLAPAAILAIFITNFL